MLENGGGILLACDAVRRVKEGRIRTSPQQPAEEPVDPRHDQDGEGKRSSWAAGMGRSSSGTAAPGCGASPRVSMSCIAIRDSRGARMGLPPTRGS